MPKIISAYSRMHMRTGEENKKLQARKATRSQVGTKRNEKKKDIVEAHRMKKAKAQGTPTR